MARRNGLKGGLVALLLGSFLLSLAMPLFWLVFIGLAVAILFYANREWMG